MKPLISIIIPVYNVAPFIKSCLHSVLNQTYKNIEIIIIIKNIYEKIIFFDFLSELSEYLMLTAEKSSNVGIVISIVGIVESITSIPFAP